MGEQEREARGPQPEPEHQRMEVFIGTWKVAGRQHDGIFGPAARVTAMQTYEWLPGRFFIVLRFDGQVGDTPASCIEVMGYDSSKRTYPAHTFYNDGNKVEWQLRERANVWVRTAAWHQGGKTVHVRSTTVFHDDGSSMAAKWEHSKNGASWQTFWDVTATRV